MFYHAIRSPGRRFHLLLSCLQHLLRGVKSSVFFYRSVFYGYYPSTRACTHCAVFTAGIWFWSGDSLSFCYLKDKQYSERLKSGLLATTFFLVMHGEWVSEARRDALHGSSSFFV